MDLQKLLDNAVAAARAEEMKTSPQLTVGEMILKLEHVVAKTLPVKFDVAPYYPSSIDSWRGSYDELALSWGDKGEILTAHDMLVLLRRCIGTTFGGYKGGSYVMGKTTPVWVANYGESTGFRDGNDIAVVDVREDPDAIILITDTLSYIEDGL